MDLIKGIENDEGTMRLVCVIRYENNGGTKKSITRETELTVVGR